MPTSGSCRRSNAAGGYTLLEMVVVLALLAMATALVAPAGYRMIQTWRDASEVDRVVGELQALSWQARTHGRPLKLAADETLPNVALEDPVDPLARLSTGLPDDWTLKFLAPLQVGANGVCRSSEAVLQTSRQVIDLEITSPYCRVRRSGSAVP